MLELINKCWGWTGIMATEVISVNDFGNILVRSGDNTYWRLCPEELDCRPIAGNKTEFHETLEDEEFKEDWAMYDLAEAARNIVGELDPGEKYCLKLPVPLGGLYDPANLGKLPHDQLIAFTGEVAYRVKDLPEGQKFRALFD